jgi:hypothetical protein
MLPFYERGGFKEWVYQVTIALDQLVNSIFNGSADETISSRCFRLNARNPYKWMEKAVNLLFQPFQGPDHCRRAYLKELNGRQRPQDFAQRQQEASNA